MRSSSNFATKHANARKAGSAYCRLPTYLHGRTAAFVMPAAREALVQNHRFDCDRRWPPRDLRRRCLCLRGCLQRSGHRAALVGDGVGSRDSVDPPIKAHAAGIAAPLATQDHNAHHPGAAQSQAAPTPPTAMPMPQGGARGGWVARSSRRRSGDNGCLRLGPPSPVRRLHRHHGRFPAARADHHLNTVFRRAWAYSELMPTLPWLGTGLAPLLQWLLIPPLALSWTCGRLG